MVLFSIIFISASCWLGHELLFTLLKGVIDDFVISGIGFPFGVILSTYMFYITNLYFPFSFLHGVVNTMLIIIAAASLHFIINKKKNVKRRKLFTKTSFCLMVLPPFSFLAICLFLSLLSFGKYVRGACYGDLPFHLNIINSFVYGCNSRRRKLFDNVSPFFAGEPLAYPVLPNFLSAILVGCFNTSLHYALVLPSLPFAYGLFSSLCTIAIMFSKNNYSGFIAPLIFIFSGGLGFTRVFDYDIFSNSGVDYVHNWGNERYEYWLQTLIHVLLPQRSSLFGITISYGYLVLMLSINFRKRLNWKLFLSAGLLISSLPQVQPHALIGIFEWTLCFGIINFPWGNWKKWENQIICYLIMGIPVLFLATPQLLPFLRRVHSSNFFLLKGIWKEENKTFLSLWWNGLGVFFVISIIFAQFVLNIRKMKMYIPSLFVFAISNFVYYQPWNLDNTKVFYSTWFPLAVSIVAFLFCKYITYDNIIVYIVTLILFVTCCFSGFLGIVNFLIAPYSLFDEREDPFYVANWAIKNTDYSSVWITDSDHNHPIVSLAGKQTLIGYKGWLISHNINYGERDKIIFEFNKNTENTKSIDKLNVTYLCYKKEDRNELKTIPKEYSNKWKKVFETKLYLIYKRMK